MTRVFVLATVVGALAMCDSSAASTERQAALPSPSSAPDLSIAFVSDGNIVEVADRRYRRGPRYQTQRPSYGNRYDYRPNRYDYRPYSYSYRGYYYPRYYGTPRFGYYNYGYGRGSVRVGPLRVWW